MFRRLTMAIITYISAFLTFLTITSSCVNKQHVTPNMYPPKRDAIFCEVTLLPTHMSARSGNLRYHIANINTANL